MYRPHLCSVSLLVCAATLALSGCTSSIMSSRSAMGGAAPTVAAVGLQQDTEPNNKQEVQFSEDMDASTINAQTFTVADSSGHAVAGVVSYNASYHIASFQPSPALQPVSKYTATIATGVASAGGAHLAAPYTYTFTTTYNTSGDYNQPFSISSVNPASGATCVSATAAITITFNRPPDASTVNATNIVVTGPGGVIPVTISINVTTTQVVLTPASPLPSGAITVTVNNVGDLADKMMAAPYTWSFSTECGGGGTGNEYLYVGAGVTAGTPEFYGYAINSATGLLTPVPGSPFQASIGATPSPCGEGCSLMPLADPLGRFLFYNFTQTPDQRGVGTMKVDPATGALTNDNVLPYTSTNTTNPIMQYMSVDPEGRYLFGTGVLNQPQSDWLTSIVIASDGTLSWAPGEPFELPYGDNGNASQAPAVTDQFVFASDPSLYIEGAQQPSDMFTFTMNQSNGALTATSITYKIGVGAGMQVVTPSGKFLYVETHQLLSTGFPGPAQLDGYQVNADGTLTPIAQAPIQSPQQPAILTMSPNGKFLYISGVIYPSTPGGPSSNDNSVYAIDPNTGSLTLTADYTNIPSTVLFIDPAVKYAYFAEFNSTTDLPSLAAFTVDPNTGALAPVPGGQTPIPSQMAGAQAVSIVRPQ